MGTSKTKITIYETGLSPLMEQRTFKKWAASCKPNNKITTFAKEQAMYQNKTDGELPSDHVALYVN